jgi:hypothetical protein
VEISICVYRHIIEENEEEIKIMVYRHTMEENEDEIKLRYTIGYHRNYSGRWLVAQECKYDFTANINIRSNSGSDV